MYLKKDCGWPFHCEKHFQFPAVASLLKSAQTLTVERLRQKKDVLFALATLFMGQMYPAKGNQKGSQQITTRTTIKEAKKQVDKK